MPLPFGQSLPQPLELIALSLTPFSWRRGIGEQLRSGLDPAWILNRLLSDKPKQQGLDRPALMSRASAALSRAADQGLHFVPWSDASYPAALSAIVDPPPALWVRGNLSAHP